MARTTRMKALKTEANKHGLVLVKASRNVEPATVVASTPAKTAKPKVWEATPKQRLARYNSQPAYWRGKASNSQRNRVIDAGGTVTAKTLAWQAAEQYAALKADENGLTFQPITRF